MIIRSRRVLTDTGIRAATVHVRGGTIDRIGEFDDVNVDAELHDCGDDIVMAGLVDTHVHVNEPGRTEWEGFASATRAAAAGGVTTIFDMPLNSIPATTSVAALDAKRASAAGRIAVNVGFIGGVVPGNARDLRPLFDAGVHLFKCFLVPSGIDEFPAVGESDLREALPILASLGATLMVHAELPEHIVAMPAGDPRQYDTYLASRPPRAETAAVETMVRLADEFGARVHIVHVSSAESLPIIRAARARGVAITCETCPHYLAFCATDVPNGATQFKCAPPIRDAANRAALLRGVMDGDIDLIAADHSPCPTEMKSPDDGDFFQAWGGIASLQLGLPAVWQMLRHEAGGVEHLAEKMSVAPAKLAGLAHRKGRLVAGFDADIIAWNPEVPVDVDAITLYHRHAMTPYRGRPLTGAVRSTWLAGVDVFMNGSVTGSLPGAVLT
ncbi:allantoinase AllB [soil metagenome]